MEKPSPRVTLQQQLEIQPNKTERLIQQSIREKILALFKWGRNTNSETRTGWSWGRNANSETRTGWSWGK